MESLSYSDIISTLALIAALGALAWNIVRDFIKDRVSIKFNLVFGEMGSINNSNTGIFADAGSLRPNHYFDMPGMLVQIVNNGRHSIGIKGVGGHLKTGDNISIAVKDLPKMLHPYEIFSSMSTASNDFIKNICEGKVEDLWVLDTMDKKWNLSCKGWERLKTTASYIQDKKHIPQ